MPRAVKTPRDSSKKTESKHTKQVSPPVQYRETDKEKLELHKSFLQNLQKDENGRLSLIENKTAQLFSQTGIIIAILGLFIPLILDKIDFLWLRLVFVFPLLFAGFFYLRTIYFAGKNLDIQEFKYPRSTAATVSNTNLATPNQFLAEEVRDLLYSIPIHIELNNKKGNNLLSAHNSYFIANIATAVLSASLCLTIAITYHKNETTNTKIDGVVRTKPANEPSSQPNENSSDSVGAPSPAPVSTQSINNSQNANK